jgi:hypothetical protein
VANHPNRNKKPGDHIVCPFVYADGRKCPGHLYRARAYGPRGPDGFVERSLVKKYRLWCSEKGDHAGAVSDFASKERMEFYPDRLPRGVEEALWRSNLLDQR